MVLVRIATPTANILCLPTAVWETPMGYIREKLGLSSLTPGSGSVGIQEQSRVVCPRVRCLYLSLWNGPWSLQRAVALSLWLSEWVSVKAALRLMGCGAWERLLSCLCLWV